MTNSKANFVGNSSCFNYLFQFAECQQKLHLRCSMLMSKKLRKNKILRYLITFHIPLVKLADATQLQSPLLQASTALQHRRSFISLLRTTEEKKSRKKYRLQFQKHFPFFLSLTWKKIRHFLSDLWMIDWWSMGL